MPSYNGVHYSEVSPGSPSIDLRPQEESRLSKRIRTDWQDLVDQRVSTAFCGYASVASDWPAQAGKKFVSRSGWADNPLRGARPFEHPDWPEGFLLCNALHAEGFVPDTPAISANDTAQFTKAQCNLDFVSPKAGYRHVDDALCVPAVGRGVPEEYFCLRAMEVEERATSKAQTLPADAGLIWNGTNRPVSAYAFIPLWEVDVTLKWWPVPIGGYNEAAFLGLVGKTNPKPFPPPPPAGAPRSVLTTKAAGTLVMGAPGKEVIRMGDTSYAYKITLRLKFYPYGANSFYWWDRPPALGGPGFHIARRPDGSFLFPTATNGGLEDLYQSAFIPPA